MYSKLKVNFSKTKMLVLLEHDCIILIFYIKVLI